MVTFALSIGLVALWPGRGLDAEPTGIVRGKVVVARPPVAPAPLAVTVSQDVCGRTVPSDELVVGPGGALANVVVWVEGAAPPSAQPSGVSVTLTQKRCRFEPHVATATVGTQIALRSDDPLLHSTHAFLGSRTLFNVALPIPGMVVRKPVAEPGRMVVKCDPHPWELAHVHAFRHPYHAVTAADGTFTIRRVPPGQYAVRFWHERLGEKTARAAVAAGAVTVDTSY